MSERVRNAQLTIGTTSSIVAPEVMGNQRRVLVLNNTSTGGQVITVSWEQEAVAGKGIVLYPGGSWSEAVDSGYIPSPKQVYAVSSAAGGLLSIHERVL